MMRLRIFLLVIILTACIKEEDYKTDIDKNIVSSFIETKSETINNEKPKDEWWKEFNDEILNYVAQEVLAKNKTLEEARYNLLLSRQEVKITSSTTMPEVSAIAGAQRQVSPVLVPGGIKYNLFQAGFDASWEIDILGKNSNRKGASEFRFLEQAESFKYIALSIVSEAVKNYMDFAYTKSILKAHLENLEIIKKLLHIGKMEVKAGEVSETDISPIMTQLNDANILVSSTQANMLGIIYRLAVLSGKMPEEMLKSLITNEVDIIQYDAGIVPVGLKSDVLKRRADVKMAEFELSASILDAKAQGKEFFPTFNLTGTLGYGNTTLGSAFSNPKQIVNASAFFNWPLFQGGGVIAGFEISKLQAKLALMNYESTILSAISDAETAILNYANALALSGEAKASLILAGKVLNMTTNQFNAGEISEKEFLNAKLARNQAYISYLGYHSNSITSLIAVHKAIGGGFEGYTLTVEKDKVIYKKNE